VLVGGHESAQTYLTPLVSRGTHDIRKSVIDVDYELRDVTSLNRERRGDYPAICRHSGFWDRDEYVSAIAILAATVPATTSPPDRPGGRVPPKVGFSSYFEHVLDARRVPATMSALIVVCTSALVALATFGVYGLQSWFERRGKLQTIS
jgi:hypothetical protein